MEPEMTEKDQREWPSFSDVLDALDGLSESRHASFDVASPKLSSEDRSASNVPGGEDTNIHGGEDIRAEMLEEPAAPEQIEEGEHDSALDLPAELPPAEFDTTPLDFTPKDPIAELDELALEALSPIEPTSVETSAVEPDAWLDPDFDAGSDAMGWSDGVEADAPAVEAEAMVFELDPEDIEHSEAAPVEIDWPDADDAPLAEVIEPKFDSVASPRCGTPELKVSWNDVSLTFASPSGLEKLASATLPREMDCPFENLANTIPVWSISILRRRPAERPSGLMLFTTKFEPYWLVSDRSRSIVMSVAPLPGE